MKDLIPNRHIKGQLHEAVTSFFLQGQVKSWNNCHPCIGSEELKAREPIILTIAWNILIL